MTILQETLQHITLADAQQSGRLTLIPLQSSVEVAMDYVLLDAAQAEGLATVTEVSEDGSVPELLLDNGASLSLFLLDGEELLGAKQNRIVNLSLLIPGKTRQTIPVSCVEAGRWHHQSDTFASTDRAFFASGRARKSADVTASMASVGSRRTNQGAVWEDVSTALEDFEVASQTDAVSDLYDNRASALDAMQQDFHVGANHVGGVFAIDGKVVGIELFDASSTWQALMPKLLRSYSIDALRESNSGLPEKNPDEPDLTASVQAFLERLAAAKTEQFDAVGEGSDLRMMEDDISGGALLAKDRIIHFCAFALEDGSGPARMKSRRSTWGVDVGRTVEASVQGEEF